jgi:hypothetical protein
MGNCLHAHQTMDQSNDDFTTFDHYTYIDIRQENVKFQETQFTHNDVSFYIYSFTKNNIYRRFTLTRKWNYLYRVENIDDTLVYYDTFGNSIVYYEMAKSYQL